MGFQFPPTPTVGEQILADNNVLYEWDGVKWVVAGQRRPPPEIAYLPLSGGAMTGPLTLAHDPVANMQPVTLQYLLAHSGVMIGGTAPSNPRDGELWWNDTTEQLHVWDATANAWFLVGGGAGGASVTVSDTAPANPGEGDLWFDSVEAQLYVNYDGVWVIAVNQVGAYLIDAPMDGSTYMRRDGAWVSDLDCGTF